MPILNALIVLLGNSDLILAYYLAIIYIYISAYYALNNAGIDDGGLVYTCTSYTHVDTHVVLKIVVIFS